MILLLQMYVDYEHHSLSSSSNHWKTSSNGSSSTPSKLSLSAWRLFCVAIHILGSEAPLRQTPQRSWGVVRRVLIQCWSAKSTRKIRIGFNTNLGPISTNSRP